MTGQNDRFWLERLAVQYLDALSAGDLDTIADFWEQASLRPELAQMLDDLNQEFEDEAVLTSDLAVAAGQVVAMARQHLPTAFPIPQPTGPLVGAEVARRLESEPEFRRLDKADRIAHARLLADATPLPRSLARAALTTWLHDLRVDASPNYIKLFRHVATLLDMARAQGQTRLAAARPSEPMRDIDGETT